MDLLTLDGKTCKILAEALAIGLLVGIERYKDREPDEKKTAGVRTFTIIALLGAICGLLAEMTFILVTFGALSAFLWLGYYRHAVQSLGLTTEFAALLVFWLGFLLHTHEVLAISTGIVLTIILACKRDLHEFVRDKISEIEFYDTLKFLVVVFVVFPLLPDRSIGPYGFINPSYAWLLVILVSTISYSGYFLIRWLGNTRGLKVSGLIGGIVSTTAVTMSLAERSRRTPSTSRLCGITGVMANAIQFPRLLLLVWVVDRHLGEFLSLPLLGMGAAGLFGAWLLGRIGREENSSSEIEYPLQNPCSLTPALKFGSLFIAIFLIAKMATVWLGEHGIYLASALAGIVDASAISLSIAQLVHGETLSVPTASFGILIAVTVNALAKEGLVWINGTRELAFWLGGGLAFMLGMGWALIGLNYVLL
jgi:uncharacterized membrane protein (DUF4010 family)